MEWSDIMPPLFWSIGVVGLAVESALYFFAPGILAGIARAEVASMELELPPRSYVPEAPGTDPTPWAVSDLGLGGIRVTNKEAVGMSTSDGAWMRLRWQFFAWTRTMAIARIRADVDGNRLRLEARMTVVPRWSLLGFAGFVLQGAAVMGYAALHDTGRARNNAAFGFVVTMSMLVAFFAMYRHHMAHGRKRLRPSTEEMMRLLSERALEHMSSGSGRPSGQ